MHENLKRSNFGKIPLLTAELSVIERLKNLMFNDHSGFIFDRIFYIPAGKENDHKSLDEFEFRPDPTSDCGVSCH